MPGCARRVVEVPVVTEVPVVKLVRETPPAELLECPARPDGFRTDIDVQVPTAVRAAMIRIAKAFAANSARLERLIRWHDPKACPAD